MWFIQCVCRGRSWGKLTLCYQFTPGLSFYQNNVLMYLLTLLLSDPCVQMNLEQQYHYKFTCSCCEVWVSSCKREVKEGIASYGWHHILEDLVIQWISGWTLTGLKASALDCLDCLLPGGNAFPLHCYKEQLCKLCVEFCVFSVSKNREDTQTDTKGTKQLLI